MNINQYSKHKYLSLNTNDSTSDNIWNIPNLSLSNKSKIALIRCNSTTDNDSNLYLSFCRNMNYNNYYSSLNTYPLIYSGVGLNNTNIPKKLDYTINGANLNEIQIYNYVSTPQNNFSYPELDGLKPNLWLKMDTGEITTNSGTDTITLTNNNLVANAGVSVYGDNSASFNGTNKYLNGTITGIANNSFSVSVWAYSKTGDTFSGCMVNIGSIGTLREGLAMGFGVVGINKYAFGFNGDDALSVSTYPEDVNKWVHVVFVYDSITLERMIYRNGVKINLNLSIAGGQPNPNNNFRIGSYIGNRFYNGFLDDVRVYTGTVLTQNQINTIYNNTRLSYPIIKNESYNSELTQPLIGQDLSPILWYKFDDTTNIGLDSMGKLNLGVYASYPLPTYDTNAYRGSGSAKFIAGQTIRANYNYSDFIDEITICFWLKINGLYGTGDTIMSNTADGTKFLIQRILLTSNFQLRFLNSGSLTTHFVGQYVADSIWKHYTITIKNKLGAVEVNSYLNGVFNATSTTGTWDKTNLTSLTVGQPSSSSLINLDDLRFYNRVLSQTQITDLYAGNVYYNLPTTNNKYSQVSNLNATYNFEIKD